MLAVIKDEEQLPLGKRADQQVEERTAGLLWYTEASSNLVEDQSGLGNSREFHHRDLVPCNLSFTSELQRQPRLADSAGAGQRQQRAGCEGAAKLT
jgi:hypothetical protein